MKRKDYNDNLLSQTAYWEMKLGIKHSTEKARYKKLCGHNLSKDERKDWDGVYYITFSNWKEYMEGKLSVLNQAELLEYSKYINLRLEKVNVFEVLVSNYFFPFLIAIVSPLIAEIFIKYLVNAENDLLGIVIEFIVCMVSFYLLMKYVIKNVMGEIEDNKVSHLFYKDMYELVTSKLQQ